MDLVVTNKTMVNSDNTFFNAELILEKLTKKEEYLRLLTIANGLGYAVNAKTGVIESGNATESYISITVCDEKGDIIPDSDGSFLNAYEPVKRVNKRGKSQFYPECLDELIDSILQILSFLESGKFVITGTALPRAGVYKCESFDVEVLYVWKKRKKEFAMIAISSNDISIFPRINKEIFIDGCTGLVISIG